MQSKHLDCIQDTRTKVLKDVKTMMTNRLYIAALIAVLGTACGGTDKRTVGTTPGDTHVALGNTAETPVDQDIQDTDLHEKTPDATPAVDPNSEVPVVPETDPDSSPEITFVIKNQAEGPLTLNMDKGWQAVIFSYRGTPPNAKSMLMFPTHCTASCDADKAEVCPYCPAPTRARDIKAAEKQDDVSPGDTREVKWNLLAFDYEKTRGTRNGKKNARCNCYREVAPEPGTYTVKACGLRKTKDAKKRSQYQCVETQMTLPITESQRIELNFD